MAAPLGNKFAVGAKGGGRKSRYEERESAFVVLSILEGKYKITQKPSGWNTLARKVYDGTSDRLLAEILRKVVPDLIDATSKGEKLENVKDIVLALRQKLYGNPGEEDAPRAI